MPNYRRPRVAGARWFFTVALQQRGSDLLVREIDALRNAVAATRASRPFEIEAMVVLPDHWHAVWALPVGDDDFSTRIGAIKARFTRAVRAVGWNPTLPRSSSKIRKGEAGVWQRRFWEHLIRDEADWRRHVAYCWANPQKHGFVTRAVDWPHSAIHRDIRRGLVPCVWQAVSPDGEFGE